jgi:hypothetical protein
MQLPVPGMGNAKIKRSRGNKAILSPQIREFLDTFCKTANFSGAPVRKSQIRNLFIRKFLTEGRRGETPLLKSLASVSLFCRFMAKLTEIQILTKIKYFKKFKKKVQYFKIFK